jgi:prepilin-type N-terminal cleavage/methylation domain-containing protein
MKSHTHGFTLIELLVVISIIALLSSVVLSTLTAARIKGADSAVKAGLKQLDNQSQVYLDTTGGVTFGTSQVCSGAGTLWADAKVVEILTNIQTNAASAISCDSTGTKWAVSVPLRSGSTFCADNNQGFFKTGAISAGTGSCI